jgi:hypothetical protein
MESLPFSFHSIGNRHTQRPVNCSRVRSTTTYVMCVHVHAYFFCTARARHSHSYANHIRDISPQDIPPIKHDALKCNYPLLYGPNQNSCLKER